MSLPLKLYLGCSLVWVIIWKMWFSQFSLHPKGTNMFGLCFILFLLEYAGELRIIALRRRTQRIQHTQSARARAHTNPRLEFSYIRIFDTIMT